MRQLDGCRRKPPMTATVILAIIVMTQPFTGLSILSAESSPGFCGTTGFMVSLDKLMTAISNNIGIGHICTNWMDKAPETVIRISDSRILPILEYGLLSREPFVTRKALYGFRMQETVPDADLILRCMNSVDPETRAYTAMLAGFNPDLLKTPGIRGIIIHETDERVLSVIRWATNRKSPLHPKYPERRLHSVGYVDYYTAGRQPRDYLPANQQSYQPEQEIPESTILMPPVYDYDRELVFQTPRISFGAGTANIHLGDDCAWFRDGTPVFAAAPGIVRLVYSSLDWGNLLVIEHRMGTNRFCTLYGHCADDVMVRAGDLVSAGELIATTGMSYTHENGGYGSHLHFSIAAGRWLKPLYRPGYHLRVTLPDGVEDAEILSADDESATLQTTKGLYKIGRGADDLNARVQWLKGYQTGADGTRGWLDPFITITRWDREKFLREIAGE